MHLARGVKQPADGVVVGLGGRQVVAWRDIDFFPGVADRGRPGSTAVRVFQPFDGQLLLELVDFVKDNPALLSIFVDEMSIPVLTVPLSIETILRPNKSTAWIGFTTGTGEVWQAVDILSWNFSSY